MKVSICTITYNHESFIKDALDSILNQKVNFDFELVISDDASTDNTSLILRDYQQQYPDKIRLILHQQNVGVVRNFYSAIAACQGDYVAICEGDDYWTDEKKLQTQIGFLESNPDFAICFHRCRIVFSGMDPIPFPDYNETTPSITGFSDLIKGNYIHTPSCVFRNHLFESVPPDILNLRVGDWSLHLLNAQKGKIFFMQEEMAAYRISKKGFWSVRDQIFKIEYAIEFLKNIRPCFSTKYKREFRTSIADYSRFLLKLYWRNREFGKLIANGPSLLIKSIWN